MKCQSIMNFLFLLISLAARALPITRKMINSDENLKAQIDANNGGPIPPGYHSYLVLFVKKPDFEAQSGDSSKCPDFSVKNSFFSSGTILNRRWVLTVAEPVATFPLGTYWMVSQRAVPTSGDPESMSAHDIDAILLHPKYDSLDPDGRFNLALAKTGQELEFSFDTRSVNTGFPGTAPTHTNCKLVLWSWFYNTSDKEEIDMSRSEVGYPVNTEDCSGNKAEFEEYQLCLSNSRLGKHCGVNSGAPVVCNLVLVGVYVTQSCNSSDFVKGHRVIRTDTLGMESWIDYVTAPPDEALEAYLDSDLPNVTEKVCHPNTSAPSKLSKLLLILLLLNTKLN